ncbi:MAG: hypothetical protein R3228_06530, partial [Halioglobus sp.]|nr:hypothetical protein [Halioglobus sp.]
VQVHTDTNFYRARLTCGAGIAIETNYKVKGAGKVRETRETTGVLIRAEPAGEIDGDYDFTMLGLEGDIIVLFDRDSGLPLQVRGEAPRVGATIVDLKSVTMRSPDRGG